MTSFIKIFSNHFPEIDITKPAFHNQLDESIINKDFFAYSIVNTLALKGNHMNSNTLNFIQYKFKILKNNILTNSFISDEKKDYYFYVNALVSLKLKKRNHLHLIKIFI